MVLSDAAQRTILSLSERLVATAHENNDTLDLRLPRRVDKSDSDLRERHIGKFSNNQIRRNVRLARDTIIGAFDTERAANTKYPDSRFDELQALMSLCGCGTPQGEIADGELLRRRLYTPR